MEQTAQRLGITEHISADIARQEPDLLDRREAFLIGRLAEQAHAEGYRFDGWPTVRRAWFAWGWMTTADPDRRVELEPGDRRASHVELHASVKASPRD